MLRSVNAPYPSRSAVRKTDDFLSPPFSYSLSFLYRLSSSFLRRNHPVRCFWCSPTLKKIRSAENVVAVRRRRLTFFSFYVQSLPFLFFRLCYSPPRFSCYSISGASIKFIRPLVAATLQDGSRRLATLCFSTFTLSSLLFLSLSLLFLYLSPLLPISWIQSLFPSFYSS